MIKSRSFWLLWNSQLISQVGNRMYQIAILWWLFNYLDVGQGTTIGFFMVLTALPAILFVNKIGKIIDTHSRKLVLLVNDALGIALSIIMLWSYMSDNFSLSLIFLSAFLYSLFTAFIIPTLDRVLPEIVDQKDLSRAIQFNTSTQTLAHLVGAALGGIVYAGLGVIGVIAINGLTYVISSFCDFLLNTNQDLTKDEQSSPEENKVLDSSGWSILKQMPLLKKALLGFAIINFFGAPVLVILPAYNKLILNGGSTAYGLLEAAISGGMLVGAFSSNLFGLKNNALMMSSICLFFFGLFLALPGAFAQMYFYGFCLFISGFSLGLLNVRMITYFHSVIENEMKGRFFAILQALVTFVIPFGFFLVGFLVDIMPIMILCGVQGICIIFISFYFYFLATNYSRIGVTHEV